MSRTLAVEYRPTETLSSRPQTARVHSKKQLALIAKSIMRFGFTQPILVGAGGVIFCGEARWRAALSLGEVVVPTIDISHLSAEELRTYAIADNKLAELAAWDETALRLELGELHALGVDLTGAALADHELQRLLRPEFNDPDSVAPPLEDAYRTRLGDVWCLGKNRLICGDATNADTVQQLLGDLRPHLMVTDPPYGVDYDPAWRADVAGLGGAGIARGKVLNDRRADWREAWALFRGSVAYVWHGGLHGAVVAQSLVVSGFNIRAQIIWVKQRAAISRGNYHWQHEPAFYAVAEGQDDHWRFIPEHKAVSYAVRKGEIAQWNGGRRQSTVWQIEHVKNDSGHGTQKPIECMRRPILNNSKKGDAVYEPFSGSGTTILAGEQTERPIFALELDPRYVDLAVKRWQLVTGQAATRDADGAAFNDVEPMHGSVVA